MLNEILYGINDIVGTTAVSIYYLRIHISKREKNNKLRI